ncbi:hypothetical protein B0T10DRAFT_38069 [Thelonectria olida]|uniref:Mid2 domain-containing protein n=1 Tax=Thelonectria olida TaxID=1576542 RepID=A0A9P8W580_9HYPO|nr:hypothetical protein B0T10DRAFT_38069 [Thelonectria olida]
MYISSSLLFGFALFWDRAIAETSFSQPPSSGPANNFQDNPTYKVGEKIDLQWSSNLTSMDLVLWQQYPAKSANDFYYDYLLRDSRSTSLIWTIDMTGFSSDVAKGQSAIFYLAIYEAGVTNMDASSHYFNVTLDDTATSTTTAASATKSAGKPTTSAAEAETTTASSDNSDSGSDGLATGAIAGIAVGATVGGGLLLGALGFLLWRLLRKRDSGGKYSPGQQYPPPEMDNVTPNWVQTPQSQPPVPVQHQMAPQIYEAPLILPSKLPCMRHHDERRKTNRNDSKKYSKSSFT